MEMETIVLFSLLIALGVISSLLNYRTYARATISKDKAKNLES